MENHPIPQDVTGFQFKLIGNMTIKQFAYLATGIVLAWALYQLPIYFLLKFPFCAFFAILGIGLAYYPISGRPMDVMIGNYIKAFFRPTEFIYEKTGGKIYFSNKTQFTIEKNTKQYKNDSNQPQQNKLRAYLAALNAKQTNKLDEKENKFLASVSSIATGEQSTKTPTTVVEKKPITSQPAINQPGPSPIHKPNISPTIDRSLAGQAVYIQRINNAARQMTPSEMASLQKISRLSNAPIEFNVSNKPQEPSGDKKAMPPRQPPTDTAYAIKRSDDDEIKKQKSFKPHISWGQIKTSKPPQKQIDRTIDSDTPNLITGITKDARGNSLTNILVEVRDKDGNPVRAFKTNPLGKFASATPLTNGAYTVEFEDPRAQNKFEKITINAVGKAMQPIEAISVDTREELRRSLFTPSAQAN
jgi:hypothetical protein